jgi:apoptosis-inducing factor 2
MTTSRPSSPTSSNAPTSRRADEHTNMTVEDEAPAVVVVVGGGYGGVNVAKALDADAGLDIVLVEPKDAFVHTVATLRALVEPAFLPTIFLPYDRMLAYGRVVRDRAVQVDAHRVTLASGAEIRADYIVLATGSRYPFPAKSDADATADALGHYRGAHEMLARAEHALLIGAGAVGIELAGEITSKWPGKRVTLLDSADDLMGGDFRPELRAELRRQLLERGVDLRLGQPLRELPKTAPATFGPFSAVTASGEEIAADIWFRCFGVEPVSDYLGAGLASARRPDGFIAVEPTLQLAGHPNVFAIGDAADVDAKMAGRAGRQAHLVADNIRKLVAGERDLAHYEPIPPAIVLPIGPEGGSGQLPGTDELMATELVAQIKGRDLMVGRYAEILGVAPAGA